MRVWFTADTHFGHAGAKSLYRRPFASVAEMDAVMAARWNDTVSATDTVYHLGDFALRHRDPEALLNSLHGSKHLLIGNNDPPQRAALSGWDSVQHYHELELDGVLLVLCHYPFRTWRDMGRGAINLHGHSHARLKKQTRQYDVGVDARDFRPVTLDQLRRRPTSRLPA